MKVQKLQNAKVSYYDEDPRGEFSPSSSYPKKTSKQAANGSNFKLNHIVEKDELEDDVRGVCVMRAWGCRRVKPGKIAEGQPPAYGRVSERSLRALPRLPETAWTVDAVTRTSRRSAGNYPMNPAFHQNYHYYRRYGNAGLSAATSQHHNFPCGGVPVPETIYSDGAMFSRSSKIKNPIPRGKCDAWMNTKITFGEPAIPSARYSQLSRESAGCNTDISFGYPQ